MKKINWTIMALALLMTPLALAKGLFTQPLDHHQMFYESLPESLVKDIKLLNEHYKGFKSNLKLAQANLKQNEEKLIFEKIHELQSQIKDTPSPSHDQLKKLESLERDLLSIISRDQEIIDEMRAESELFMDYFARIMAGQHVILERCDLVIDKEIERLADVDIFHPHKKEQVENLQDAINRYIHEKRLEYKHSSIDCIKIEQLYSLNMFKMESHLNKRF